MPECFWKGKQYVEDKYLRNRSKKIFEKSQKTIDKSQSMRYNTQALGRLAQLARASA